MTSTQVSGCSGSVFVWMWLPGATEPVLTGRLDVAGEVVLFSYERSYLERAERIPVYLPELPLRPGRLRPGSGLSAAGCIRDAGPDSWGQRVIRAQHAGRRDRDGGASNPGDASELGGASDPGGASEPGLLSYLIESGSDRIGGLDFQTSASAYTPRLSTATLEQVHVAADELQSAERLSPELGMALLGGTAVGGARPKALIQHGGRHLIAKLSSTADRYPVVKAEAVAMELARRVGLTAAHTEVTTCLGRDVLLVERFDRTAIPGQRRVLVSALTMLGLDKSMGRSATYPALADLIRQRFTDPVATLRELFARIVFNICVGNTDDHPRNHAAFWDGSRLTLTPAYDLCPQLRSEPAADQAIAIGKDGQRASRLEVCRSSAEVYLLSRAEAGDVIDQQVSVIGEQWDAAADAVGLTARQRQQLWQRQILNPDIHTRD